MAKDAYWFTHDANASSDPKLVAVKKTFGMSGIGQYWTLIEYLRQQEGYRADIKQKFFYSSVADLLMCTIDECEVFINRCIADFELLKTDDQFIWSDSLCRRMEKWDAQKRSYSERGKKGANATNSKKSAQAATTSGTSDEKSGTSGENHVQNPAYRENINKEDRESDPLTSNIHEILINSDQLKLMAKRTNKTLETANKSLLKFHLDMNIKKKYPMAQNEAILCFEKWLINEFESQPLNNKSNAKTGNIENVVEGLRQIYAQPS